MFDENITKYTEKAFHRQHVEIRYKSMVTAVKDGFLTYKNTATGDSFDMPYGMCGK
jgi:NADH dehydrogenase FAD-containing subunit